VAPVVPEPERRLLSSTLISSRRTVSDTRWFSVTWRVEF
jgi:hypothetical protein